MELMSPTVGKRKRPLSTQSRHSNRDRGAGEWANRAAPRGQGWIDLPIRRREIRLHAGQAQAGGKIRQIDVTIQCGSDVWGKAGQFEATFNKRLTSAFIGRTLVKPKPALLVNSASASTYYPSTPKGRKIISATRSNLQLPTGHRLGLTLRSYPSWTLETKGIGVIHLLMKKLRFDRR